MIGIDSTDPFNFQPCNRLFVGNDEIGLWGGRERRVRKRGGKSKEEISERRGNSGGREKKGEDEIWKEGEEEEKECGRKEGKVKKR